MGGGSSATKRRTVGVDFIVSVIHDTIVTARAVDRSGIAGHPCSGGPKRILKGAIADKASKTSVLSTNAIASLGCVR
jgi:hypothetical protein